MRQVFPYPIFCIAAVFIFFLSCLDLYPKGKEQILVIFEEKAEEAAISAVERSGVLYTSLKEFVDLLDIIYFTNPQNKKMILRIGAQTVKVTPMNPFIMVDDMILQMAIETIIVDGEIYIPLKLFLFTIGEIFPVDLDFDNVSKILWVGRIQYNITGVEVEDKANGTIIRFITAKEFEVSNVAISFRRGWLNVTFYGGLLDSAGIVSEKKMSIVDKIVPFQFESSAQISFLLDQEIIDKKVYVNEREILLWLWSSKKPDIMVHNPSEEELKRWVIDRIIIDPGHGGKHPGAVGRSGLLEKEVTLDIAKRLKKLLQRRLDMDVLMTRQDDRFVELSERTKFANTNDGKLFISIHADGNNDKRVRGFSTYFLGVAKTQQALEVAQRENSVIELEESAEEYEEFQDAAYILNAIAQSSYLKESENLANMVNKSLKKWTKIPDLGVHQAGFIVLIGTAMPSILVETGFLSNTYEERLLRTRTFRQKIAEALCKSVGQFKEKYGKGIE